MKGKSFLFSMEEINRARRLKVEIKQIKLLPIEETP